MHQVHSKTEVELVNPIIGLNHKYAIHDYELPFDISEYILISEINRKCVLIKELEGTDFHENTSEFTNYCFNDIEELIENIDDII
ncbi:Antirestriction protein [Brachybacterium faecium]|nr:Antirestriction protein [Brachybacterium faecium]